MEGSYSIEVMDITVAVTCELKDARGIEWTAGREALSDYFEQTWKGRISWVKILVQKEWDQPEGKL